MTDKQDSPAMAFCSECGCELYENDECYLVDGELVCEECMDAKRYQVWELRGSI